MKTEVKKLEGDLREIHIEEAGDVVTSKFNDAFEKIAKEAKIPGFRPGHAPRDLIEKNFSGAAHDEVVKELVPELYNQAIDKEGLDAVELPEVYDVKLDKTAISFKAKIQVFPEINLKKYRGLKINYKKVEATADEVKRNLDAIQEARKLDKADDVLAKSLGYPSLTELEGMIKTQIILQKESSERQRMEDELAAELLKDLDFTAPQPLVNRQLQELVRQAKLDLALKGVQRQEIEKHEDKLSGQLKPEAEKQVRIFLVLSQVAKKEGIAQDEHMQRRVMELLFREADWNEVKS